MKGTWIDGEISNTTKFDLENYLKSAFKLKLSEIEPQLDNIDEIIEEHGGFPLVGSQ